MAYQGGISGVPGGNSPGRSGVAEAAAEVDTGVAALDDACPSWGSAVTATAAKSAVRMDVKSIVSE